MNRRRRSFFSGCPFGRLPGGVQSGGAREYGIPPTAVRSRGLRLRALLAAVLLPSVLVFLTASCATVPPGHAGVVLAPSGVVPEALPEGVSGIPWFGEVSLYDTRQQEMTLRFNAITADGSPAKTSASAVTYRIAPREVVALARELGPDYAEVVVRPEVESAVRLYVGGLHSDELDTADILSAQAKVTERAAARLRPYHVVLESVDLRTLQVVSPQALGQVAAALVFQQELLAEPRLLEITRKEADARREEASGLKQQFEALRGSLSEQSLADLRLRAWDKLLRAPSTTVHVEAKDVPAIVEVSP